MIRTVAVNWAPILDCSKNDGKTAVETTSDEMVMGAPVWAFCELCALVRQQNHSDLSLVAQDDALKRFYQKRGAFQEQKISKSAKANVDEGRKGIPSVTRTKDLYNPCCDGGSAVWG